MAISPERLGRFCSTSNLNWVWWFLIIPEKFKLNPKSRSWVIEGTTDTGKRTPDSGRITYSHWRSPSVCGKVKIKFELIKLLPFMVLLNIIIIKCKTQYGLNWVYWFIVVVVDIAMYVHLKSKWWIKNCPFKITCWFHLHTDWRMWNASRNLLCVVYFFVFGWEFQFKEDSAFLSILHILLFCTLCVKGKVLRSVHKTKMSQTLV